MSLAILSHKQTMILFDQRPFFSVVCRRFTRNDDMAPMFLWFFARVRIVFSIGPVSPLAFNISRTEEYVEKPDRKVKGGVH